jgi:hypothetical protein
MRLRLSEQAIRSAVISRLLERKGDFQLIEELGIGGARADLALITEQFLGFEIKSDFDTLDRLAHQMHAYHGVFDALTIVTTKAYLGHVEALLPAWWGIWAAEAGPDGSVVLQELRCPALHGRRSPFALAAMLWRDDAYAFAIDTLGPVVRARATRLDLQEIIGKHVPIDRIRERVLLSLRNREDLKARSYLPDVDGGTARATSPQQPQQPAPI